MKNDIISWITGKSDLSEVSLQELENVVYRYPYFTLAQLLLTVKMKSEKNPGYAHQLQKTALNFQDPQWLHFQLASLGYETSPTQNASDDQIQFSQNHTNVSEETSIIENESTLVESEDSFLNLKEFVSKEAEDPIQSSETNLAEIETLSQSTEVNQMEEPSSFISEEKSEVSEEILHEEPVSNIESKEETNSLENHISPISDEKTENHADQIVSPYANDSHSISDKSIEEAHASDVENTNSNEELEKMNSENADDSSNNTVEVKEVNNFSADVQNKDLSIPSIVGTYEQIEDDATEDLPSTEEIEHLSQEIAASKLSSIIAAQAEVFKSKISTDSQSFSFDEPKKLATKDYFASIGVKIDTTVSNDFSQKVKKFSDWLKQMKKVGPEQMIRDTNLQEEEIIIKKADASNIQSEVLTESMVQILIQQGKKSEAIDILQKLSLLKPEKSAYFASQIDFLKDNK